jgi:hypothetical protein
MRGLIWVCISCARAGLTRQGRRQAAWAAATACTLQREPRHARRVPRALTATETRTATPAGPAHTRLRVGGTATAAVQGPTRPAAPHRVCWCREGTTRQDGDMVRTTPPTRAHTLCFLVQRCVKWAEAAVLRASTTRGPRAAQCLLGSTIPPWGRGCTTRVPQEAFRRTGRLLASCVPREPTRTTQAAARVTCATRATMRGYPGPRHALLARPTRIRAAPRCVGRLRETARRDRSTTARRGLALQCQRDTTTRGPTCRCISCARAGLTRPGRRQAAPAVATARMLWQELRPAVSVPRGRTGTAGGTATRALRASILQAVATTAAAVRQEPTPAAAPQAVFRCLQGTTTRCGATATTGTTVARFRRWQAP